MKIEQDTTWKELANHYAKRLFPLAIVGGIGYYFAGKWGAFWAMIGFMVAL